MTPKQELEYLKQQEAAQWGTPTMKWDKHTIDWDKRDKRGRLTAAEMLETLNPPTPQNEGDVAFLSESGFNRMLVHLNSSYKLSDQDQSLFQIMSNSYHNLLLALLYAQDQLIDEDDDEKEEGN